MEVEYLYFEISIIYLSLQFVCYHNHLHFSLEFVGNLFRYPWHASCKIEWQFPQPCSTVRSQIVRQINAWEVSEASVSHDDM